MSKTIFMFPGQGSQHVGMVQDVCAAFPEAKEAVQEAEDSIRVKISDVMFSGPEETLKLTSYTQPALMVASLAVFRVLEKQGSVTKRENPVFYAGHSLGEYSALCAAGSFTISEAACALRVRGTAMQQAAPAGSGAMIALLGTDAARAEEAAKACAAKTGQVCEVANDNGGGQFVVSGGAEAVKLLESEAKVFGIRKTAMLPVSAPFHSSLMKSAAQAMRDFLGEVPFKSPRPHVISNVTAQAESDPETIRELLVAQVTGRVRWRESMEYALEHGVTRFIEIGAGSVLAGLMKRIHKDVETLSIRNCADIDAYLNRL